MKKKAFTLVLFVFSLIPAFINAQKQTELYEHVVLRGNIITNTLNAHPAFSYFDFTFSPTAANTYTLTGVARDENGNALGDPFVLTTLSKPPAKPIKNLERGHLYLNLSTMNEKNVDGSEDYILTPKKCKDRDKNTVDYVSYRFSNKVYTGTAALANDSHLIDFDLNPSPPYSNLSLTE